VKFKTVSKIKEPISVIGLGCWAFAGSTTWDLSGDEKSISIIREALDAGINLLDVAPVYGKGHSEKVVGQAIKGYDRSKILIASKCGLLWDETGREYNNLHKDSILKEIDESLCRLQTDYIDIYQLHWPDPTVPLEETLEAIRIIKKAGKIRYFGVTNFALKDVETMMQTVEVCSQQGLYNMLERNAKTYHALNLDYRTESEILPYCLKHGQAFFPYTPYLQGLLCGTFKESGNFSEQDVRHFNPKLNGNLYKTYYQAMLKLKALSESYGHPLNELAVNWLISNPAVTSVIGSIRFTKQLDENLKALDWELIDEMKEKVNEIIAPFEYI
jgi:aryl-alcohol dehydrogenase-like predicted oxidoreductase